MLSPHCDIALQVSDEGGGIPRSGLPKIWTYLYTTAKSPLDEMDKPGGVNGGSAGGPAVLAGGVVLAWSVAWWRGVNHVKGLMPCLPKAVLGRECGGAWLLVPRR